MIGLELQFTLHSKQLKSKDDALLLVIHCFLVTKGYRCVGTGNQESSSDKESEQLPNGWNANSGSYTLRYKKIEDDKKLLLKILRVDNNSLVNVLQTPGDLTATVDLPIDTYLTNNYTDYQSAFVNDTSLNKLEEMLKKMMNDLQPSSKPERTSSPSQKRNEQQRRDPLMEPQRNYPPMSNPRSGIPGVHPNLPSLGRADLDPLQRGIGGGMIMDPQGFPAFNRPRPQRDPFGLPPGAVPPGARFDPFGPPMGPRRPGPGGNFPGSGRYANPDPDDIRRPDDYDDMFM